MGKLDVHISHGGGGEHQVVLVVAAIIAVVLIAGSAAAVTSVLTSIFIWLASIIGGGFVLGFLAWYFTRDYRAKRDQSFEQYRQAREEAYHQKQLEKERIKAQVKAQENAAVAMMVAEAIRVGHQQQWPGAGWTPSTYESTYEVEVVRDKK